MENSKTNGLHGIMWEKRGHANSFGNETEMEEVQCYEENKSSKWKVFF